MKRRTFLAGVSATGAASLAGCSEVTDTVSLFNSNEYEAKRDGESFRTAPAPQLRGETQLLRETPDSEARLELSQRGAKPASRIDFTLRNPASGSTLTLQQCDWDLSKYDASNKTWEHVAPNVRATGTTQVTPGGTYDFVLGFGDFWTEDGESINVDPCGLHTLEEELEPGIYAFSVFATPAGGQETTFTALFEVTETGIAYGTRLATPTELVTNTTSDRISLNGRFSRPLVTSNETAQLVLRLENTGEDALSLVTGHQSVFSTVYSEDGNLMLLNETQHEETKKSSQTCWKPPEDTVSVPANQTTTTLEPGESKLRVLNVWAAPTSASSEHCLSQGRYEFIQPYRVKETDEAFTGTVSFTVTPTKFENADER